MLDQGEPGDRDNQVVGLSEADGEQGKGRSFVQAHRAGKRLQHEADQRGGVAHLRGIGQWGTTPGVCVPLWDRRVRRSGQSRPECGEMLVHEAWWSAYLREEYVLDPGEGAWGRGEEREPQGEGLGAVQPMGESGIPEDVSGSEVRQEDFHWVVQGTQGQRGHLYALHRIRPLAYRRFDAEGIRGWIREDGDGAGQAGGGHTFCTDEGSGVRPEREADRIWQQSDWQMVSGKHAGQDGHKR